MKLFEEVPITMWVRRMFDAMGFFYIESCHVAKVIIGLHRPYPKI